MKNLGRGLKSLIDKKDPLARDLSHLLKGDNWKSVQFELKPKDKTVTIRMNGGLLNALKVKAKKSGVDYQKYIRLALEHLVK